MTGTIIDLALRPERYADMARCVAMEITAQGPKGDHAGKYPDRAVSILAIEDWRAACALLDPPADADDELSWLTRRANILTQGLRLPRAKGARLKLGTAELEVTGHTHPCKRMEEARAGLLKALAKEWRGGVLCAVITPGEIVIGDEIEILSSPEEITRSLP